MRLCLRARVEELGELSSADADYISDLYSKRQQAHLVALVMVIPGSIGIAVFTCMLLYAIKRP